MTKFLNLSNKKFDDKNDVLGPNNVIYQNFMFIFFYYVIN